MNNRKAFTLIELLVVMGIIVVLITILVPIIAHTRQQANITAQKADFQTITTALEAYRQDFGDYPRNTYLPTWNYDVGGVSGNYEAPACFTLATALVGPGPAVTQALNGIGVGPTEAGDGADGPGFRTQVTIEPTTLAAPITPVGPWTAPIMAPSWNTDGTLTYATAEQKLSQTTLVLSPGTAVEERVGIAPSSILGSTIAPPWIRMFSLASTPVYSHPVTDTAYWTLPAGKVWPSYLPAERFKVTFVNFTYTTPSGSIYNIIGQPVLLDRWGNPIQYFTKFGASNNRTNPAMSTYANAATANVIGPLYGYSAPKTVYATGTPVVPYGMNSIWDQRDGGARFTVDPDGQTNTKPWQLPGTIPPTAPTAGSYSPFDAGIAFRWMLGDEDNDNLIDKGEALKFDGPFILISAGPSPINPPDGGFCNMGGLTPEQKAKAFKDSGNIYNFER